MAKGRSVEETLAKMANLRGLGRSVLLPELARYLGHKTNLVAAKAARLAREEKLGELEAALVEAFGRFMRDAVQTDRGCAAKKEIAEALYEMGCSSPQCRDVFLAGVKHFQPDPGWGGAQDSAAELRGLCALGLVRMAYREVMPILVDLLMDPSPQARMLAARAVAYAGRDEGALLLRLKILAGDKEEDVLAECVTALGRLSGSKAMEFLGRFLEEPHLPGLLQSAAMAIGEMRTPEALALLRKTWTSAFDDGIRSALLLPMVLTRLPEAVEFLMEVVEKQRLPLAAEAVTALGIYRHDPAMRARVEAIAIGRKSPELLARLKQAFA